MATRVYIASGASLTITAAHTIIFLNPGTTCSLNILRCWVDQSGTAAGQQLPVQMVWQVTAFPSTGVGVTPAKTSTSDPISQIVSGASGAAGTVGVNYTTEGAGAKTVLMPRGMYNANGWEWVATPREVITMGAGAASGFGLYLPGTPTTLTGWNAGICYEEV